MSLILWASSAFLLGILAFFVVPLVAPARVTDTYGRLMAQSLWRGALVRREQGGLDLVTWWLDGERGTIQTTLDGETVDITDADGFMSYLYNKRFGIIDEGTSSVTDPLIAGLGHKAKEQGYAAIQEQKAIPLPAADRYVDPARTDYVGAGDRDANAAEQDDEFMEKSQAGFKTPNLVETASLMLAFGVGFGLVFVGVKYGGGGGGSPISVGMFLGGFL